MLRMLHSQFYQVVQRSWEFLRRHLDQEEKYQLVLFVQKTSVALQGSKCLESFHQSSDVNSDGVGELI